VGVTDVGAFSMFIEKGKPPPNINYILTRDSDK